MGFKDSFLRGRIAGLKRNIAIAENLSDVERVENLKKQLATAEAELNRLTEQQRDPYSFVP